MPTGLVNRVEWMVMAEFLRLQDKKIILIAPQRLVAQQQRCKRNDDIAPEEILRYTGETRQINVLKLIMHVSNGNTASH